MKANPTVTIQLDSNPDGSVRIRSIPSIPELQELRQASVTALTQAELYALAALGGIEDMKQKLRAIGAKT